METGTQERNHTDWAASEHSEENGVSRVTPRVLVAGSLPGEAPWRVGYIAHRKHSCSWPFRVGL